MPSASDPRVMVRMTVTEHSKVKAAAERDGVTLAAFVRDSAVARASGQDADALVERAVQIRRAMPVAARSLSAVARDTQARQERLNDAALRRRGKK